MELIDFLEIVIVILNDREEEDFSTNAIYYERFIEYYKLCIQNKPEFYCELHNTLKDDIQIYFLTLTAIYELTGDVNCYLEMQQMLLNDNVDIYLADSIQQYLNYYSFVDKEIPNSYSLNRKINSHLLNRFLRYKEIKCEFTPYRNRNKKRIIISTNQLLSPAHAPSKIVLDVCSLLQKEHGYEVRLIVCRDNADRDYLKKFFYRSIVCNYVSELEREFAITYNEELIIGYQYEWKNNNELDSVLQFVEEWKPLCVLHIGGATYKQDIYKEMTTLVAMPCTSGYMVSEAQILLGYMPQDSDEYIKECRDYINNSNQIMLDLRTIGGSVEDSGNTCRRTDYNIAEDDFVISIVGNRLDCELTKPFEKMICNIIDGEKISVVIIGDCSENHFDSRLKEKIHYLGYRSDLTEVLRCTDLFVNPVRKGGGGGAVCAAKAGIPVISLKCCDVASILGEEVTCDSLEEMQKIIHCYINDKAYYDDKVCQIKNWFNKRDSIDRGKVFNDMLEKVKKILEE